jgi:hypothetical protein
MARVKYVDRARGATYILLLLTLKISFAYLKDDFNLNLDYRLSA